MLPKSGSGPITTLFTELDNRPNPDLPDEHAIR